MVEVVQLLLATGQVDPKIEDNEGRTPLSRAAERGHKHGCRAVSEFGMLNKLEGHITETTIK